MRPVLVTLLGLVRLPDGASAERRALLSYADGGDGLACWSDRLMRDCSTFFPGVDLLADWGHVLNASRLVENEPLSVPSQLVVPSSLNVTRRAGVLVDHVNLHACKVSEGFCSPFVSQTPGLVTHSPQERGGYGPYASTTILTNDGDGGSLNFVYWTLIIHYRVYVSTADADVRADFAKGMQVQIHKQQQSNEAPLSVQIVMAAIGGVAMLTCALLLAMVLMLRHTTIMRMANWRYVALMLLGAMMANGSIFTFLYSPSTFGPLTETKCLGRLFLIPLGFDLLFLTLLVKTWHVRALVRQAAGRPRSGLCGSQLCKSSQLAACGFGTFVLADVLYLISWATFDQPEPTRIFSKVAPSLYQYECFSPVSRRTPGRTQAGRADACSSLEDGASSELVRAPRLSMPAPNPHLVRSSRLEGLTLPPVRSSRPPCLRTRPTRCSSCSWLRTRPSWRGRSSSLGRPAGAPRARRP